MVGAAPRVRVPAAQVQDRRHRRDQRPHGRAGCTTSGSCSSKNDAGEIGFRVHRRRRHGPHADHRSRDPRVPAARRDPQLPRRDPAHVQPLRPARQQVQGAHQDPRQGAHAGSSSRATSKTSGRICKAAPATVPGRGIRSGSPRTSPCRRYETLPATTPAYKRGRRRQPRVRATGSKRNVHPHKVPGYAIVTLSLKKHRRAARRRDVRPDGRDRRPRRPLSASASCRVSHEQNLILPTCSQARPVRRCGRS